MKRRAILLYLGAFLTGCMGVMKNSDAIDLTLDDGITDITPVFVLTHTQGENFAFIRINFWFMKEKKSVQLSTAGAVSVNGIGLNIERSQAGISYIARIPLADGIFNFSFFRTHDQLIESRFELPHLDIKEMPKNYGPHEPIRVPMTNVSAFKSDAFVMYIKFPQRVFDFKGHIGDGYVDFFPVIKTALPTGTFSANIFRQQRIPLRDVSSAKTGWAVISISRNFTIEVEGPNKDYSRKLWMHDMSGRKGVAPHWNSPFVRSLAPRYVPVQLQTMYSGG